MRALTTPAVLLLIAACTPPATTGEGAPAHSPTAHERSAAQIRAAETGEVTADEYEQAFREFQACMAEGGYEVSVGGMTGNVYDYSFPQAATGAGVYEPCYEYHLSEIDSLWQAANEDFSYTTELIKRCLRDHGIDPLETSVEVNAQLDDHLIDFVDCL